MIPISKDLIMLQYKLGTVGGNMKNELKGRRITNGQAFIYRKDFLFKENLEY